MPISPGNALQSMPWTADQEMIRGLDPFTSLFIEGPAGTGKTTAAVSRLESVLSDLPGYQVIILTPQRSLAQPYRQYMFDRNKKSGGFPNITTLSGLSQELAKIFWPLICQHFPFQGQSPEPTFLSLETAQYCMGRIVDPLLEKGYFQSVKIEKNRLYSQILDNLNKIAIQAIPLDSIEQRLTSGALDSAVFGNAFAHVQDCASLFRSFCYENNLLDFSLLTTIAEEFLFRHDLPIKYLKTRFKAIIADNIEEDTPFTHRFLKQFAGSFESITLIYDHHGGFRTFLGADAENAYKLKSICERSISVNIPVRSENSFTTFAQDFSAFIDGKQDTSSFSLSDHKNLFEILLYQFLPEMVAGITQKVVDLVDGGTAPDDIAILSPYLSDVLQFSLTKELQKENLFTSTARPSRTYYSSSAVRAILTLAKLAYPEWQETLSHYEFRNCLMRLIPELDVIRAEHAARALLGGPPQQREFRLFDNLTNLNLQETITFTIGQKLTQLSGWINNYKENNPKPTLDVFFQRAFGEVLSQPGFTIHEDLDAANDVSRLVASFREFLFFANAAFQFDAPQLGKLFLEQIHRGLLPAAFPVIDKKDEGVIISPAHTFLMQNKNVSYQFWLDVGSLGWWERLYQPLTNPYVYQTNWHANSRWSEELEYRANQEMMAKMVNGLLLRCRKGVFATIVQTNEYGVQNSGPLLRAMQKMLKHKSTGKSKGQ